MAQVMGHKRQGTTALYSHLFADAFEGVEVALDAVLGVSAGVNQTSTERGVSADHSGTARARRSGETRALAGTSAV